MTGIIKGHIWGNNTFLQCCTSHNGLKCGTWLIYRGYRSIAPCLTISIHLPIFIRIIGRSRGHSQHFAGFRIHNHCRNSLWLVVSHSLIQCLLHNKLHGSIQGQGNILGIISSISLLGRRKNRIKNRTAPHINENISLLSLPLQQIISSLLHSSQAYIIRADEPQHISGQAIIWIIPFYLVMELQTVISMSLLQLLNSLFLIYFQTPFHINKNATSIYILLNLLRLQFENICKRCCYIIPILCLNLAGIENQRFGHTADSQLPTISIRYFSPRRLTGSIFLRYDYRSLLQLTAIHQLQPCHTHNQNQHQTPGPKQQIDKSILHSLSLFVHQFNTP